MKSKVVKLTILVGAAAATGLIILGPTQGFGQEKLDEKAKQNKAKQIAQILENNSRELTVLDRGGKIVKTVGPKGLYEQPVFSPDGTRVVVAKPDLEAENEDLWVFDVESGGVIRLTTSQSREQTRAPVWSPDATQIAYIALRAGSEGIYKKASNGTGSEELLYKLPGAGNVLTDWSLDGRFLSFFSSDLKGSVLSALPLQGEAKPIEVLRSETTIQAARPSPDSRFLAYRSNESGKFEVYVREFDAGGGSGGGKWKISDNGGLGMVAWRRDGKELFYYAPDRGIMSVQVNTAGAFEFGKPKLLFKAPDSFPVTGTPGGLASISRDGQRFVLALPPAPRLRQITVLDRQGKTIRTVGEPGLYDQPALSPDGTKVAVTRNDQKTGYLDIWAFDVATGKGTAITNDEDPDIGPIWSPDGRQILYSSSRRNGNFWGIYRKSADGSGSEEQLFQFTPGAGLQLTDVSADGKFMTFSSGGSLFVVPLAGASGSARKAIEYARDEFDYFMGRFSADSRFMAFVSDELGVQKNEVFVQAFDAATGTAPAPKKWQISRDTASGIMQWRADGKELYIVNDDLQSGDVVVWAADVSTSPSFTAGTPKVLFRLRGPFQGGNPGSWKSISRDGQQFVFTMPVNR